MQVQDYGCVLKMNSGPLAIEHFYRLFNVCVMLRTVKVDGRGMAHNYPQIQLAYMLILAYQYKRKIVSYEMLMNNQSMYNEDMGEITFSVLSRCVLGDNNKSMFDHLEKVYCMVPYVQQVVRDIGDDFGSGQNSINWRHTISPHATEVSTTGSYFSSLIRQVESNVFKCYDGSERGYKNLTKSREHMVASTLPVVYMNDMSQVVSTMIAQLKKSLCGYHLYHYRHIWPEADIPIFNDDVKDGVDGVVSDSDTDSVQEQEVQEEYNMSEFELEPAEPLSQIDNCSDPEENVSPDINVDVDLEPDGNADEFNLSQPLNEHLNRSWGSWGNVSAENIVSRHRNNRFGRGRYDRNEPGWDDIVRRMERRGSCDQP